MSNLGQHESFSEPNDELLPIVDEQGNVIGKMTRGKAHDGSKTLHPVVHLHVFNSEGRLFLQHRPHWKFIQPDHWDTATGGHIGYGESIDEALHREVEEELGITQFTPQLICKYVYESQQERELIYVFRTVYDGKVTPSDTELDGGRFFSPEEIRQLIGKDTFTPNFEYEYVNVIDKSRGE